MKYIEVKIIKIARPMGNNADWERYDCTKDQFNNLNEAKEWLKNQYFYCKKKIRRYIEDKNGNSKVDGWIYCFKLDPVSYDDCKHYEQHWVSIYEVKTKAVNW
jgi:hypothetical protein